MALLDYSTLYRGSTRLYFPVLFSTIALLGNTSLSYTQPWLYLTLYYTLLWHYLTYLIRAGASYFKLVLPLLTDEGMRKCEEAREVWARVCSHKKIF